MKSKYSAEEKFQIVMESFTDNVTQAEICRRHGIYPVQLIKWKEQFILGGKSALAQRRNSDSRDEEIQDLKDQIPLREISRISGISLSGYYYRPKERHVERLDPSIKERIKDIASERPIYGYRRVWAVLRNQGTRVNRKTVRKVLKDSDQNLPLKVI